MSLLDLSARVVAESISFDEMEQFTSSYPLPPVANGLLHTTPQRSTIPLKLLNFFYELSWTINITRTRVGVRMLIFHITTLNEYVERCVSKCEFITCLSLLTSKIMQTCNIKKFNFCTRHVSRGNHKYHNNLLCRSHPTRRLDGGGMDSGNQRGARADETRIFLFSTVRRGHPTLLVSGQRQRRRVQPWRSTLPVAGGHESIADRSVFIIWL